MAVGRLDAAVVRASLRAPDVLAHFGITGRERGSEFRTRLCPVCGPRARDCVVVNLATGLWTDKAHGCGGDLIAFVAGCAGLDARRDFEAVLKVAAGIAGVGPDADPAAAATMVERHRAQLAEAEAKRAKEQEAAIILARRVWFDLRPSSSRGENYLRGRGIDPVQLGTFGILRYDQQGNPCLPLWNRGRVVNVVWRVIDQTGDGPKVLGLRSCPTEGTLCGQTYEIGAGSVVVVTEGVADTLTAHLAWPRAIILGAHGASRFASIAGVAAKQIVKNGAGYLLLVGHDDKAGGDALDAATVAAVNAGLSCAYGGGLALVHLGGHNDLADAWKAGWRP